MDRLHFIKLFIPLPNRNRDRMEMSIFSIGAIQIEQGNGWRLDWNED
jgi:hypothetical protein